MLSTPILFLLAVGAAIWFALDRREKSRAALGHPRIGGIRLIFAAAAAILMLFSGGCSLLIMADLMQGRGGQQYVDVPTVLIIGGLPFVIGLVIWWLSMRRKRDSAPPGNGPL